MITITLIVTAIFAAYVLLQEAYWILSFRNRWLYVYLNEFHSYQHLLIVMFLLTYWLAMNVWFVLHWDHTWIAFVYNLLLVPITVKHLREERLHPEK